MAQRRTDHSDVRAVYSTEKLVDTGSWWTQEVGGHKKLVDILLDLVQ
jgi:hypothetical protein